MENIYKKKIVPVIVIVLVPILQCSCWLVSNIVVIWDADSMLVPQSRVYASIQKWLVGTQYRYGSVVLWSRSIMARLQLVKLSPPP